MRATKSGPQYPQTIAKQNLEDISKDTGLVKC